MIRMSVMTALRRPPPERAGGLSPAQDFRARATDLSAVNVAIIALCSVIGLLSYWPTDLLIVGDNGPLLIRFACYRALAVSCCLALAWSVLRVPAVRRRPAAALFVGVVGAAGLTVLTLGPYAALEHGWMDLGYLLPLATCALLVPLRRRIVMTSMLTAGWLALYFVLNHSELEREFLWVYLLVHGLAACMSVYVGHTMHGLLERTHDIAAALEASNGRLAQRIADRQAELRESYEHIVMTREDERLRLGRELHDATGQVLTGLRLGVGLLRRDVAPGPAAQRLSGLDAMLDGLFAAIQQIVADLRPSVLDDLGLLPALAWLTTTADGGNNIAVRLSLDGDAWTPALASLEREGPCAALSSIAQVGLYRITQATLGLFTRLEGATLLSVDLHAGNEGLVLRVVADVALPEPGLASSDGLEMDAELIEITERARMLGARLTIRHQAPASVEVLHPLGTQERDK
jgi:signal transduction histidine kinase